jgi:hypothetical protein
MQPRQRAREIGNAGERELIKGDGGHVDLIECLLGGTRDCHGPLIH